MGKLVFLQLFLMLLLSTTAAAYQVQPMIVELSSQGKNSLVTYRLQNPGDAALPVEVEVFRRSFDDQQQEVLIPAPDAFLVLPPQIEVPANGYQVFRAKYLGTPDLKQSDSFRIVFKQLPLDDDGKNSGVKMVFNFATLVFVSPKNIKAKAQHLVNCDDMSQCAMTITNQGERVLDLSHYDYHFNDGDQVVKWTQFQTVTKGRFIMPGHQVKLNITPLLKQAVAKSVKMINLFESTTP